MAKGKYKRKKKHARQQAQQRTADTVLPEQQEMTTNKAETTTDRTKKSADSKNPSRWGRFKEWASRDKSFTDWCLALFTLALACAAIYQFIIMGSQLDDMRKDQRPWIKAVAELTTMQASQAINGTTHLINNGKTPARWISGDVVIEKVKNGEEPKLDYAEPHGQVSQGTLFPGEPSDVKVWRSRRSATGGDEIDPMTQDEFDDFKALKIFFVVYGTVRYSDFYGIKHWTKFCQYVVPNNVNGAVTAQRCANYGDIDGN